MPRPAGSTLLHESVTVAYPDGSTVTGDVIRTRAGVRVLWTGRAARSLPRKWTTTDVTGMDTLNVRGLDPGAAKAIKAGASARGLTIGQYLHRLALLHVAVREAAAGGDEGAAKILATLGLETVTA